MTYRPRIYLAGPTVFMRDARARGDELKTSCETAGCEGLFPLDADMGEASDARRIMTKCLAMLDRTQAVVADLSPFRGPHVDDGTAFELGYAAAHGLPIFGYATDLRPLRERIPARSPGETVDADGIAIEDIGEPFNAMVAGALTEGSFRSPADAIVAAVRFLRAAKNM